MGCMPPVWKRSISMVTDLLLEALATPVREGGKTAQLCFFIDGLDEFEESFEDCQNLIDSLMPDSEIL
jgi:hypothetical protein